MRDAGLPLQVTTLAERKSAEAARRRQAAEEIVEALRGYARRNAGRFVVFGSYVGGSMRFDSDLDILIDFPPDQVPTAWHFAEGLSAKHDVPLDIHDAGTTTPRFVERVMRTGIELS